MIINGEKLWYQHISIRISLLRVFQHRCHRNCVHPEEMTLNPFLTIFQDCVRRNDEKTDVCSSLQISVMDLELLVIEFIMSEEAWSRLGSRAATAGKAPKAWALPRFWVSIRSYKKQPVKKIWGRILGLAWLKFAVAALSR